MAILRGLTVLILVGGCLGASIAVARPSHPPPSVVALQLSLVVLGYNPGPIDGYWGPRTMTALTAYGQDRGIVLNQATLKVVLALLRVETLEELRNKEEEAFGEEASRGSSPRMLPIGHW